MATSTDQERMLARKAKLARGKKNLGAMQRTAAHPTTSSAGKKTLAEMVVRQTAINNALEKGIEALDHQMSSPKT